MDAILEYSNNPGFGQSNSKDRGTKLERNNRLLLGIVPYNHLIVRVFWLSPAADQCEEIVATKHFSDADAGIEVSRYTELTRVGIEDAEACIKADREAACVMIEGRGEGNRTGGLVNDRSGIHDGGELASVSC